LTFDLLFTSWVYLTPLFAVGDHDRFKNLRFRGLLGSGGGLHLVRQRRLMWDFGIVGGLQWVRPMSGVGSSASRDAQEVAVAMTTLELEATKDLDLNVLWATTFVASDVAQTYHSGSGSLSLDVAELVDLDVAATFSRAESPRTLPDGELAEKNDLTLTVGLGLDF